MHQHENNKQDAAQIKQPQEEVIKEAKVQNTQPNPVTVQPELSSIFDKSLHITKDMWAVSYLKRAGSEHGFLLIQSDNMFYQRELAFQINNSTGETILIVDHKQREYDTSIVEPLNFKMLQNASNLILWGKVDTTHTLTDLFGKTWLITKAKAQELMQDIDKDTFNPPAYFKLGKDSILEPSYMKESFKDCTKYTAETGFVSAVTLSVIAASSAFIGMVANSLGIVPLSDDCVKNTAIIVSLPLSYAAKDSFKEKTENIMPKGEVTKVHSCATWVVEKLKNLGIQEINNALTPQFFDSIAYVTSFHLGSAKEQLKSAAIITVGVPICAVVEATQISKQYCSRPVIAPEAIAANPKAQQVANQVV